MNTETTCKYCATELSKPDDYDKHTELWCPKCGVNNQAVLNMSKNQLWAHCLNLEAALVMHWQQHEEMQLTVFAMEHQFEQISEQMRKTIGLSPRRLREKRRFEPLTELIKKQSLAE